MENVMPSDGTNVINPGEKVMYLILSTKRGNSTPRVQIKVTSVHEASVKMQEWLKKTQVYRSEIASSHLHVGGMTVAKVCYDGKVLRVDPFTKEAYSTDAPDRVLYDPIVFNEAAELEKAKREAKIAARHAMAEKKFEMLSRMFLVIESIVKDSKYLKYKDDFDALSARFHAPRDPEQQTDATMYVQLRDPITSNCVTVGTTFNSYDDEMHVKYDTYRVDPVQVLESKALETIDSTLEMLTLGRNVCAAMVIEYNTDAYQVLHEEYVALKKVYLE
jgi:hypothetical protein